MKEFTIVFTDSGLGGLSIMVDFYNQTKRYQNENSSHTFNLVFYNALAENGQGYNKMSTAGLKVKTLNNALIRIEKRHKPDIIAIACNTLSAIYPLTEFATRNKNVTEIISIGRAQIEHYCKDNQDTPVIILATPTTIESNAYKMDHLNVKQFSGANLASLIEFDYKSDDLRKVLNFIFQNIISSIGQKQKIALFLGCTHYGYIEDLLHNTASENNLKVDVILNPNKVFCTELLSQVKTNTINQFKNMNINLKIESQAIIDPSEVNSVCHLLEEISPEITDLLKNYKYLPNQF